MRIDCQAPGGCPYCKLAAPDDGTLPPGWSRDSLDGGLRCKVHTRRAVAGRAALAAMLDEADYNEFGW